MKIKIKKSQIFFQGYARFFVCFVILVCLSFISGCDIDSIEPVPDTSNITLSNKLIRSDQLLAQLDTNSVGIEVEKLILEHPEFYDIFFNKVLPFEAKTKDEFYQNLTGYLTDERIMKLNKKVAEKFSDFESNSMPRLNTAMKLMKHYFPDFKAPNIYTFISEYTYQRFVFPDEGRDGIGIGLDMFLGADYSYKELDPNNPAFSDYITRTFTKAHITKKVMEILIDDQLGRPTGSRLIDQMIHNGKKLYILDKIIPTVHDSILMEYTTEQMTWVGENELEIWAFFFDQKLFYESNAMQINKYINPSPNSPGMPKPAPGRVANYMGWQIVKAYMRKNPDTTIDDLIKIKDAQKIMDKSKYKPKQK